MNGNITENITHLPRSHDYYQRAPDNFRIFIDVMRLYFTPTIIVVGFVGNCLSSLVLLLTKLRKFSSSHYLACLLLANSALLFVKLLVWLRKLEVNTYDRPFTCQVFFFVKDISTFLSLWALVALTIDRYIAICWPAEGGRFCTVMRARIVITGLTVFSVVIYLNTSLTVAVALERGTNIPRCSPLTFDESSMMVLDMLDMILNHILAYISILVLFLFICRNVCCNSDISIRDGGAHLSLFTIVFLLMYLLTHIPEEYFYIHMTSINVFNISPRLTVGFYYGFHLAEQLSDTAKSTHLLVLMVCHPLFAQYFKGALSKVKTFLCGVCRFSRGETSKTIEEEMTLQESV